MTWYDDPKHPKDTAELGLNSRNTRTLDSIMEKDSKKLADSDVKNLLKALGFKHRQNRTSHQIWTHPETGARFSFVAGKAYERLPEFKQKELYTAMIDRGIVPKLGSSKILGAKVPEIKEEPKQLQLSPEDEKRVQVLNTFANSVSELSKEVKNNTMSEKEIIQRLKQLEQYAIVHDSTLKAVQDLLIDLGAKLEAQSGDDGLKSRLSAIEDAIKAIGASPVRTPALSPKYQAIRDAIAQNPQFKDNHKVIAALAETKTSVVAEYLSKYPN